MGKHNGVYLHNATLLSKKEEPLPVHAMTWVNLRNYVEWKDPEKKDYIECGSIHMKFLQKANLWRHKADQCLLRDGGGSGQWLHMGTTFLFEVMKVKVLMGQLCPTLCNPMDYSLPGSSVHGIFQARILEWVAIPFSRGSSQSRDRTRVSCIAGRFFSIWATREAIWSDGTLLKLDCGDGYATV